MVERIKLPFAGDGISRYRSFFFEVFKNYTPSAMRETDAPDRSTSKVEMVLYAVPKEEYEAFRECSPDPDELFVMPRDTKWIGVEFLGSRDYAGSYALIQFHTGPIREMAVFARPHLFLREEMRRTVAYMQSIADERYGKGTFLIVDITRFFGARPFWVFNALTTCEEAIRSVLVGIRKDLGRKLDEETFTQTILAEAHVRTCKKEACVAFSKDWGEIIRNPTESSWDALYARHKEIFHKWNIYKDPPT